MQLASLFSLERHHGPYEKWPRQTRLFVHGEDTRQTVPGFVIEAQYVCSSGYLLILSQDCLFEESNDFVLLDQSYNTIAQASLGGWYVSYLIEKHWPLSPTALVLDYGAGEHYCLSIEPKFLGGVVLKLVPC